MYVNSATATQTSEQLLPPACGARIARLMLESEFRSDIINAKSNDGWTPLHVAAHYGRDSFVHLLLEFRAEVDPLSDKGTTPLQLAIIRERSSCGSCVLVAPFTWSVVTLVKCRHCRAC
uniref:Ankyrin repeat and SOCS box containing 7 n=1 Tax=Stegastes partitus TaxID=144197 RepID=A0A3B5A0Q3_9TELE